MHTIPPRTPPFVRRDVTCIRLFAYLDKMSKKLRQTKGHETRVRDKNTKKKDGGGIGGGEEENHPNKKKNDTYVQTMNGTGREGCKSPWCERDRVEKERGGEANNSSWR